MLIDYMLLSEYFTIEQLQVVHEMESRSHAVLDVIK